MIPLETEDDLNAVVHYGPGLERRKLLRYLTAADARECGPDREGFWLQVAEMIGDHPNLEAALAAREGVAPVDEGGDLMSTRTRSMVLDGHSAEAEPTPERISVVQVVVLDILRVAGPLTHDQLVTLYDARADAYPGVPKATPSSIRTRTSELARKGLVVATTRVAYSQYGRRATVWDITYRKEGAA